MGTASAHRPVRSFPYSQNDGCIKEARGSVQEDPSPPGPHSRVKGVARQSHVEGFRLLRTGLCLDGKLSRAVHQIFKCKLFCYAAKVISNHLIARKRKNKLSTKWNRNISVHNAKSNWELHRFATLGSLVTLMRVAHHLSFPGAKVILLSILLQFY